MKTLVLGLGNPILSDDGVGLFITRKIEGRISAVDVVTVPLAALNLLDLLVGYDKVFVIDAVAGSGSHVGQLRKMTAEEGGLHLFSSHGLNFAEIVRLGKELGCKMPEVMQVYGIEIDPDVPFGEALSPRLAAQTEMLIETIVKDITSHLAL